MGHNLAGSAALSFYFFSTGYCGSVISGYTAFSSSSEIAGDAFCLCVLHNALTPLCRCYSAGKAHTGTAIPLPGVSEAKGAEDAQVLNELPADRLGRDVDYMDGWAACPEMVSHRYRSQAG